MFIYQKPTPAQLKSLYFTYVLKKPTAKNIARVTGRSHNTIYKHQEQALERMGCDNLYQAIVVCVKMGWFDEVEVSQTIAIKNAVFPSPDYHTFADAKIDLTLLSFE